MSRAPTLDTGGGKTAKWSLATSVNMTRSKPTKPRTAIFGALAFAISMVAIVPSARAADPTCDQFKSRLVAAANMLQQAGLPPPVISYVQQQDMGRLKVFEIAEGEADLYCRDSRFDSFDVILGPIIVGPDSSLQPLYPPSASSVHAILEFRYLVTAAIMAFTQQGAGEALKSLDKLVADVNAKRDANTVLESHAVMHLYGGDHFNFQINAGDALYGSSPGEE
jgi:hypothetical protein